MVEGVPEGATGIKVATGCEIGPIIYVGELAREQCEMAVVESFTEDMTVIRFLHSNPRAPRLLMSRVCIATWFTAVERPNVDGKVPADWHFRRGRQGRC